MSAAPAAPAANPVLAGLARLAARQDLVLAGIVVLTVLMMVLPVPTAVADALVAVDIGFGLILVLLALYVRTPTEFSTLPTVILVTTAFRLSVSITTSRLVLVQADAGAIIRTFGEFVIAGNVVVGLVVYLIITVVQFVVITKGSERVAEVAARFTLDALPGKQSSIDTELRNGDLTPQEARARRSQLERESHLYGAMDGAMKFVKGDAIASLLIIAVNLLGGIAIGCLQRGLPFSKAVQTYSLLAVGDGLIAQIPALLVSLTAGVIVTRATVAESGNLGEEILGEVTAYARPLQVAGPVLAGLALVPGFPAPLFLGLGAGLGAAGLWLGRRQKRRATAAFEAAQDTASAAPEPARVEVCTGAALAGDHPALQARLDTLRDAIGAELGIAVPRLRLRADAALAPSAVHILVDGIARLEAEAADPAALEAHVRGAVLGCAGQFVGIQETQALLARIEPHYGDLVREAAKGAPLPRLAEMVRRLVEEQVSVANLRAVLEAVAEWGPREASTAKLADHVRVCLGRQLCHRHADTAKRLSVVLVEGPVEEALRAAIRPNAADAHLALDPGVADALAVSVRRHLAARPGAVVVTAFDVRRHLHLLLSRHGIEAPVLAHPELAPEFGTEVVATVGPAVLQPPALPRRLHAVPAAA